MSEAVATEAPAYRQTTFSNLNIVDTPAEETPAETSQEEIVQTPVIADEIPVVVPAEEVADNTSNFNFSGENDQSTPEVKPEEKATATVYNWKEEIKKIDKKELLKEAGITDFALEINEYLQKGGKAEDYLNAKAIDYGQVSDEELIKADYKKQFPNLTSQEINRLFTRKYGISEEMTDEEKEDRGIELKADGHLKRQSKISEQQTFKIPDTPILQKDEAYEQWKQQQEAQPVMMEKLKEYYSTHEVTKALNESKKVAINLGEGVTPFNFSIDNPEFLTRMLSDGGETFQKLTSTKSGEPDVAKQHILGLVATNPQKVFQDIYNYGVQMGKRKLMEEGQNATKPQQKVQPPELNGNVSYSTGKFSDKQR